MTTTELADAVEQGTISVHRARALGGETLIAELQRRMRETQTPDHVMQRQTLALAVTDADRVVILHDGEPIMDAMHDDLEVFRHRVLAEVWLDEHVPADERDEYTIEPAAAWS